MRPLTVPEPSPLPADAACDYAAAGWYVAPVKPGTKNPGSLLGDSWQHKTSRDPDTIRAWWQAWPNAGIALHAGRSGAVILDVDHPDAMPAVLASALTTITPPMQTTRQGGDPLRGHYLYLQPEGRTIGNGVGRLGTGWGDVRGLNGVIMVAPSVHLEPDGEYAWRTYGDLPPLPEAIAALLDDASPSSDAATDRQVAAFLTTHTQTTQHGPGTIDAWVRMYLNRARGGDSRHQRMISVLTGALKEAAAGLFPAADAAGALNKAWIETVTQPPAPGGRQCAARTLPEARTEWAGILAWAVGQASDAPITATLQRAEAHAPTLQQPFADILGPAATTLTTPAAAAPPSAETPATAAGGDTEAGEGPPPSWQPVDLGPYLDGTYTPPTPGLAVRDDGVGLLYPGLVHDLHGESESGKSLVAQAWCADLIKNSQPVLYIDFESGPGPVIDRMLNLGCAPDQLAAGFTYVRPETTPYAITEHPAWTALLDRTYDLAVLDGVTDALGMYGGSTKDNDDIAAWHRAVPRALATKTGAAVILIDHVVKNGDDRGRFAIGGQAKMAAIDGASFSVEPSQPIGKGLRGELVLRVGKDRPGEIRGHCGHWRPADRTQEAARITIDSTNGTIDYQTKAPSMLADPHSDSPDEKPFRPTGLMEKISRILETMHDPITWRNLLKQLKESGSSARETTIKTALDFLISEQHVSEQAGPRNSRQLRSVNVYRQRNDPLADGWINPFGDIATDVRTVELAPTDRPTPTDSHRLPDSVERLTDSAPNPLKGIRAMGVGRSGPPEAVTDSRPTQGSILDAATGLTVDPTTGEVLS